MPNTGLNSYIGIEQESTWGVDPGGTPEWLRIVSESLRFRGDLSRGNRGLGLMTPQGVRAIKRRTEGDIVVDPLYLGMELLLLDFFGAVVTTGAGPYTHTFSPTLTRQVGLTLRVQQDAQLSIVTGLKTTSFAAEFDGQENLQCTFGLGGKVGTMSAASTSPTFPDAPPVLAVEATATNGITYKLDSVEECILNGRMTAELPHDLSRICAGDSTIAEPTINDYLTVSGEVVRDFEDDAYEDLFQAFSEHVLEFNYASEDAIPTLGGSWELQFKFYAAQFLEAKPPTDGPGAITETIPFRANADSSGNIMDVVMITNRATIP